jgi:nucleoid DNA-binding protein
MTGNELIQEVLGKMTKRHRKVLGKYERSIVKAVLEAAYDTVINTTAQGEPVKLKDFAIFTPHHRSSHRMYCGFTKEYAVAAAHVRVVMKPSKRWRAALRRG